MTSTELLNLFDKLGLPTYITSAVVIVLFMIYKFDILTLFSASSVELKLLNKEQRITNKVFSFILTNMMLSLLTCLLVIAYIEYDIMLLGTMNQIIVSFLFILSATHGSLAYIITETPTWNRLKNNKTFRKISLVLVFLTFPYLSLIIAPITAQTVHLKGLSINIILTMYLAANILTPLYLIYFIIINRMMVPKKLYYIELNAAIPPLIIAANSSPTVQMEKWYLIHPLNKDQLLLAANPDLTVAKKVKLITKSELAQYVIKVE
ncbi:hypothetical protein ACFVS2_10295 [Brevibacillus sp. NPDC058079]|uniref:hypothetical protein n=1 Tax=Brevibacillus sp. NPDC058079 TaxID=3346330 RepID=UPI0036E2F987